MSEETDLYRAPGALLAAEKDRLQRRLLREKAEVQRFEELRGKTGDELDELVWRAKEDAKRTGKLLAAYRVAIKNVGAKR